MPEAKNNISADTKRSILRHLMFGMLGLLILMNWEIYIVPGYTIFDKSLKISNDIIENRSKNYKSALTEIKVEEGFDYQYKMDSFAAIIRYKTTILISSIDSYSHFLKRSKTKSFSGFESDYSSSILKDVRQYNLEILELLSIDSNYSFNKYSPLNSQSLIHFNYLINTSQFPLNFPTKESAILALVSLKNDVKVYENLILEQVFEKSLNGVLHCKFPKSIGFPQQNVLFMGDLVKFQLIIGDYGFDDGKNFLHAETSEGKIDDSSFRNERLILWASKAKNLGLNEIIGNIIARVHKVEHKFPFSFSYFVSAPGIAFHLDKANLCYVGVPNPISISVPGYSADRIKLKVADAKVSKTGDGRFEIFFSKIPSSKVYAYVEATNEQGRTSTVHSMELKVRDLPSPTTNLSSFKESGISLEELKNLKSIKVQPVDSAFDLEHEVINFQVEGITGDGKYIEPITVHGDDFSNKPELMSVFNAASVGDRFIFSHIRAKATNGKEYEALPVSLLLK